MDTVASYLPGRADLVCSPFLPLIANQAETADRTRSISPDVIAAIKASDLIRYSASASIGGAGGSILAAGSDGILVACGSGSLLVKSVQAEGRKRMDAAAFLTGKSLETGERLGRAVPTKVDSP